MRAIAIDDEPIALDIIRNFAEKVKFIELVAEFNDGKSAKSFLRQQPVELMFLDIRMPDISGIELLKSLVNPPLTIFTTAYSEHAVKGFELNAVDYLLKPFTRERFEEACNKALKIYEWNAMPEPSVLIKSGTQQIRVLLFELLYVQSAGNYVQFVTTNEKILTRLTMSEVEELLPPSQFTRIHRSYIVANRAVNRIDKNSVYVGTEWIPIGAGYAEEAKKIAG